MPSLSLEDELEALRRELSQIPVIEEAEAAPDDAGARSEIEKMLGELQKKFGEASDDAEDIIAAHPFASVAAAFLLGILVATFMSRGR